MPAFTTSRSLLFVPASRPDRFSKALSSEADAVIIDLEDAVAQEDKDDARQALAAFLEDAAEDAVWVRINAMESDDALADLALCRDRPGIAGIIVPKAEHTRALAQAAALGKPLIPLIESAAGLDRLAELARVEGVVALSFGALDLGLDLGLEPGTQGGDWVLDQARFQLVLQSRLAGLAAPVETVTPEFRDTDVVERAARRASEMGFGGMLCIHPRQVEAVNAAFSPSVAQREWAERVLAVAAQDAGAGQVDGQMIDAPVIERARRLLERTGG
ncbi:HpcH/HpaI aldolase/citrate lyase family protein [Salinicola rhizosphaerae]|uniref:Acyl-CoA lyase subunit beta n=1 Tax=Salinicola rhizosphaerae TaxID=1443141 RepID=A0ABQ3E516_9GAMM|nr:CoA ester lyase [Salinicola rhizosphaerae]GHB23425.1 acyl-CoA lyase subunit beta [Salinicola rhizosphaerae]